MIDEIIRAAEKADSLRPKAGKTTPSGKIERLRFALARFDAPFSCTNVEMGLVKHKESCSDCAALFLEVVEGVISGKGLPDE